MEQDNAYRCIRATSEERIKRLKKILHSLATRVPVVELKRVEKQYPSLEFNMTVSISSSTLNDSRHHDAKCIPENSLRIMCKRCRKIFIHRDFYDSHRCMNFDCMICFKSFSYNCYLKHHMLTHNSRNYNAVNSPHLKCQKCQKTFIHQYFYDSHECRNFICKICNMLFPLNSCFKRHMSIHKKEPYKCHLCNRSFKRPCELSLHCKSGHREKKSRSDGKRKIRRMVGRKKTSRSDDEKKICCDMCDRRFLKLINLMNHKRVHYNKSKRHSAANSCTKRNIEVDEVYGKSMENGEVKCNSEEKDQILENKVGQNGSCEKDLNEFVEEEMEKGNEMIENEIEVHEHNREVDDKVCEKSVEDEEFSPNKILVETSRPQQLIQTNFDGKVVKNNSGEGKVNIEINSVSGEKSKEKTEIKCKLNQLLSNHHSQVDATNLT